MLVLYLPLFKFLIKLLIVSKHLSDPVRSHKDPYKDASPFFRKAVRFYEELAKQMINQNHVLDLFTSVLTRYNTEYFEILVICL
ncbi:putative protein transport protein Sec23 [Helianthus annuus]|nr:putative protein transport protein Sec23 [Helianthus annuus]KAJ0584995.1 putative protein transport protein Sec23 [Helianthus annuus]KAJ0919428.1 putative protein transport protein Sec23 [Helianthus annuus]